ncbi:MAG: SMP-30/gluconolactonase/LRE family protein [Gemmatimonas sp.]
MSPLDFPDCDIRVAPQSASQHAECPRWDASTGSVYWIDMPAGKLHRHVPGTDEHWTWQLAPELSALLLDTSGRALVGVGNGLYWFDPSGPTATDVTSPALLSLWREISLINPDVERFNDAAWAPDGSVWIATMARDGVSPLGKVLKVTNTVVDIVADGIAIGNGPAFDSQRNCAYFADSHARVVYRVSLTGTVARSTFITFDETDGFPDGMTVGTDGTLWIAHYDGEVVSAWNANGTRLGNLRLRGHCPTAIAQIPSATGRFTAAITTSTLGKTMKGGLLFVDIPGGTQTRGT